MTSPYLSSRRGRGGGSTHFWGYIQGCNAAFTSAELASGNFNVFLCINIRKLSKNQRIKLGQQVLYTFTGGVIVITAWVATGMQQKWFDSGSPVVAFSS
jgi:hypothetical protein